MAWGKAGSTTLSSTSGDIDVTSLSNNKCITFLHSGEHSSGSIRLRLNSDSGSNYGQRRNANGGTDGTDVSQAQFNNLVNYNNILNFNVGYIVNIAGEEKLMLYHNVSGVSAGAGTAPYRVEQVQKWANTSDTISSINISSGSGVNSSDSNVSVLGSDLTPAAAVPATIQDGLIFEETDTNKHYIYKASTDTWTEL